MMSFEKYQLLARKVFPGLPPEWESMIDSITTYEFLIPYLDSVNGYDDIDIFFAPLEYMYDSMVEIIWS